MKMILQMILVTVNYPTLEKQTHLFLYFITQQKMRLIRSIFLFTSILLLNDSPIFIDLDEDGEIDNEKTMLLQDFVAEDSLAPCEFKLPIGVDIDLDDNIACNVWSSRHGRLLGCGTGEF